MNGSPYWSLKADQAVDALLAGLPGQSVSVQCRRIMAIAWLQGVQHGTEKTLKEMEVATGKVEERARQIFIDMERGA